MRQNFVTTALILFLSTVSVLAQSDSYLWLDNYDSSNCLIRRIDVPAGYERTKNSENSFAQWLRHLPLRDGNPAVYLFNGKKKRNQAAHCSVLDIDIGTRDLQQCADYVIRMRAEYLYSLSKFDDIHFNFTSGDNAEFTKWLEGYRARVNGNDVLWHKSASPDSSYRSFQKYLDIIYAYAGSYSLRKELKQVENVSDMQISDVFIEGGFPGHALIVVDMAVNKTTGKKLFLLAQGYSPAQDFHVLNNPNDSGLSPWYDLEFGDTLYTPEWTFKKSDLMRF
jgi:Domain of unknown function (4846)